MYNAVVAEIKQVKEIEGANAIQIAFVLGEQVIVGKDMQIGDVGVFFMPELQLSEEFCSENNLFRNSGKNKDKAKKGFFDDNRRVRAQPFMKVKSMGYFATLDQFNYIGDVSLKVGDQFQELNSRPICQKYINEKTRRAAANRGTNARKKMEVPDFKEHIDTEQFKYNAGKIQKGALITLTAKLHGTSGRYGNMRVYQDLPKWKKLINKVAPVFPEYSYECVTGSRRVILRSEKKLQEGHHGSNDFRFEWLDELKDHLSEGMEVYGEIVGYANDKPIMPVHQIKALKDKAFNKKYKDTIVYKYGCPEGTNDFYIYRITLTNSAGVTIDFTHPQIVDWCDRNGFKAVPQVADSFVYDGDEEKLRDLVAVLTEREDVLSEDVIDSSHISEGIVIRADYHGLKPMLMKSKSYAFRCLEGLCEAVDPEDMEGVENE